jgi:putative transposase
VAGLRADVIVTDKHRSYGAALADDRVLRAARARSAPINRAENSHQPRRRRERKTQGFKSPASARRFVAIHAAVYNVVNVQGHLIRRATLHSCRAEVYPACQSAQDWVPLIGIEKDWRPITPKTGSLFHCESQSSSISSPVGGCSLCNEK